MVTGAQAMAEFAHVVAEYPVNIALHTDHCPEARWIRQPLIEISRSVSSADRTRCSVHMWDGSAIDLDENLKIAAELLEKAAEAKIILEVRSASSAAADSISTRSTSLHRRGRLPDRRRSVPVKGRYLLAATFGNVHGVSSPAR